MKLTSCLEILSRFIFRSETSGIILQMKELCCFSQKKKRLELKRMWNTGNIQTDRDPIPILIISMLNKDIRVSAEEGEPEREL